jgi:hypothetical protein
MKHIETFAKSEVPAVEVVDAETLRMVERVRHHYLADQKARLDW